MIYRRGDEGTHNTILRRNSQYMVEKRVRTQDEIAKQILPSFFAFGEKLFKMAGAGHIIESSPDDLYPGERQIDQTLQEFS